MSETNNSRNEFEIPDFYPEVHAIEGVPHYPLKDEFVIPGLREAFENYPSSFFFTPEFMEALELDNYQLRSSRFTSRPDWSIGREESFHRVFFGELNLNVNKGIDGDSIVIPIAIKPYYVDRRDAIHEFAALNLVNSYPNMEAFKPIGFWISDSGDVCLLTRFEEDVKTLDNVDWRLTSSDILDKHFEPFNALLATAKILARMHSQGLVHRDAQIKNMGIDSKGVRIVDLTQMRRIPLHNLEYDPAAGAMILGDFQELTRSVNERDYLLGTESSNKRQIIEANLITPYLSMMRHPSLRFAQDPEFQKALTSMASTILENM